MSHSPLVGLEASLVAESLENLLGLDADLMRGSLDILENRRKELAQFLLAENASTAQASLFGPEEYIEPIKRVLNEIHYLISQRQSIYSRWKIERDGRIRLLSVPKQPLRTLIDSYLAALIRRKEVHPTCHGGEPGWSVKESLRYHVPCASVLSFDMEKAFANLPFNAVHAYFCEVLDPELWPGHIEYVAGLFALLLTVKYNGTRGLPQGSPASMPLFNRALYVLDDELSGKAEERGLRYTRWVDDVTISSPESRDIKAFLGAVEVTEEHLPVSRTKTYFQRGERIYLLGHKILGRSGLQKNSREDRLNNKVAPLDYNMWFGRPSRRYTSWR
jgi:hypothetical protein